MKPGFDYIGVCVNFYCHDGSGNFVLHKRSQNCRDEQGTWDFGGGQLEFGETLEQGVLREIQEEYGCAAEIDEQLPPLSVLREHNGKPTHWVSVDFIARVKPNEVVLGEPESMDEIGWFRLAELPTPMHSMSGKRVTLHHEIFEKYR